MCKYVGQEPQEKQCEDEYSLIDDYDESGDASRQDEADVEEYDIRFNAESQVAWRVMVDGVGNEIGEGEITTTGCIRGKKNENVAEHVFFMFGKLHSC